MKKIVLKGFCLLLMLSPLLSLCMLAQFQPTTWGSIDNKGEAWVKNISRPYTVSHGLEGRHLALWASHGRFYDIGKGTWRWQRPPLFTTCEDLFTQTIVVPFLMPMLENAGAVVFTPRERDWQRHEVIVDNDKSGSGYQEWGKRYKWKPTLINGFANHGGNYQDGENPFTAGTARMTETTKNKKKLSIVTYQPNLPEQGKYAVYVSYQTVPNSIADAHYIVWHQGEKTEFLVNQRMGGSTWVYLGTFQFDAGSNEQNCVVLTNESSQGGMVTADAVRFGGGMGNIERGGTVSGMPRCVEGARYYAQWAGMPYRVYSTRNGENDYADDINVRSLMLNELCGGSVYAPDSVGRKVPIELSLAVHSDAGYNKPDGEGVFGSLTICTTGFGNPFLATGLSRDMSKDLASELLDNATIDLQSKYQTWTPREMRDKNYSETRLPVVPSAIFETLSHQSFNDMRYGLDPNFRFTLARSIYKTLLKYVSRKHHKDYVVTPLTPKNFNITFADNNKGEIRLSWTPTIDPQEPTAAPTSYILYKATHGSDFDNGTVVKGTSVNLRLEVGELVHFRVAAVNKGGQSFPTQVLSACFQSKDSPTILVVDGFQRLASPAVTGYGFDLDEDPGVSYGRTCGFLGRQTVFNRSRIGIEDETGLGYSTNELEGRFIAGNDFNYVRTHAQAIFDVSTCNILSCAKEAIADMPLYQYDVVDLLLGLERNDGHSLVFYKTFPTYLRQALSQYAAQGGRMLVSGAYVGSDMKTDEDRRFLNYVLKCEQAGVYRDMGETVKGLGTTMDIYHQLCEQHYAATSCDVLMPVDKSAFCSMLYPNGTSAAVAYRGNDYRSFVMGFPLECIKDAQKRTYVMKGLLDFLLK
jgi:hypothetical protein